MAKYSRRNRTRSRGAHTSHLNRTLWPKLKSRNQQLCFGKRDPPSLWLNKLKYTRKCLKYWAGWWAVVSPDWYFGGCAALWAQWRSEGRRSFLFWFGELVRSAAQQWIIFLHCSKHLFFSFLCVFPLCFWIVPVCASIKNPNVELKWRAEQVPGGAGAAGCSVPASCPLSLQLLCVPWWRAHARFTCRSSASDTQKPVVC